MPNLPMISPDVELVRGVSIQLFPADFSREADDLRGHLPVQVLPDGRHLRHHAGKFEGVGLHHGKLFHADVPFEKNGHEGLHAVREGRKSGKRQGAFGVELLDLVDDLPDILRPVGDEDDVEGGLVVHENPPAVVHDQTAHRLDLPQADAVVFGPLPQLVPLDHLQVPQPHHEKRQRHRRR